MQIFKYIPDATSKCNDFPIAVVTNQVEYKRQKVWSISDKIPFNIRILAFTNYIS